MLFALCAVACVKSATAARAGTGIPRSSPNRRADRDRREPSWHAVTRFRRPRFRTGRRIRVTSAAGFWRAWRALRAHDEIIVRGVTFRGEAIFANKQLPDWAEIHFDSSTKFVGVSSAEDVPAVWMTNLSRIRFYGGDVSDSASGGMAGGGIVVYDSTHLSWWGFRVHDVGAGGLFITGIKRASNHLDFKGDVSDWGHNLSWDPHQVKGTGIQGVNVADSHFGVNDSRLAFHLHDSAVGSGMEIGGAVSTDGARGNKIYLWCEDLSMLAANGVGGSCAQVWGENVIHNVFRYIEAERLAGRPYQTDGMYAQQSLHTDTLVYGRATRTNSNPVFGTVRWDRHAGTVIKKVVSAK
jgi:hypothetical protein